MLVGVREDDAFGVCGGPCGDVAEEIWSAEGSDELLAGWKTVPRFWGCGRLRVSEVVRWARRLNVP